MTKQSFQIIIYKKSLYLSSPEPFFNENYGSDSSKIWRLPAPAPQHCTKVLEFTLQYKNKEGK